jgi:hypothetical protein
MCLQDVQIGRVKWFRLTALPNGTPVTVNSDSRRVLLRIVSGLSATNITGTHVDSGQPVLAVIVSRNSIDEITIEKHGNLVTQTFSILSSSGSGGLVEAFLDDMDNPPPIPFK